MNLHCSLALAAVPRVEDRQEASKSGRQPRVEPTLEYRPRRAGVLTPCRHPDGGPCQVGSLTGAVAS